MSSQKRAAADGECREENLMQETATMEAALTTRMDEVQAELKQARLALSNAHAEIDRLGVVSTQLKKVKPHLKKVLFRGGNHQAPHDTILSRYLSLDTIVLRFYDMLCIAIYCAFI